MRKWPKRQESEYLEKVAEATFANHPLPLHPSKEVRAAIEKFGLAAWIKRSPGRQRLFKNYLKEIVLTKRGKIKIPLKHRIGRWPSPLRPKVKGYSRPDNRGHSSINQGSLSAGMPGNEETDPGPIKR